MLSPNDTVHCAGKAWYYDRFYHCHKPEGHGTVNLHTTTAQPRRVVFTRNWTTTGSHTITIVTAKSTTGSAVTVDGLTGLR